MRATTVNKMTRKPTKATKATNNVFFRKAFLLDTLKERGRCISVMCISLDGILRTGRGLLVSSSTASSSSALLKEKGGRLHYNKLIDIHVMRGNSILLGKQVQ